MMEQLWQAVAVGDKGTQKIDDFMKQNFDFCDMLVKEYKEKNVLIVTHAANVRAIAYYFRGKPENYDFNVTPVKHGGLIKFEN